ncbi:MAG: translation initiation factor IF-2, partial [Planctomycetes bacterium]|nr:translation initiation factor IF-2 [Planctomycetota bacterium]
KGKRFKGKGHHGAAAPQPRDPNAKAELEPTMSLRNLSEALGVKLNDIMGFLMRNGQLCSVNDILDQDTIVLVAEEFKIPYEWKQEESLEEQLEKALERAEARSAKATHYSRAPIVTFMGHVDHGKTSLLDKIRSTHIAEKEYGGITQHIGAYTVNKDGHKITFLDTPGHEAFTQMRARGANLTDVEVLVVAADDGVMPQTKEACAHAKNAGVPIVVAINKCDLPGANPDRVKQELSTQLDLLPEEWGGKVGVVEVSAHTGQGIDELLERILLEAEMLELDADPSRLAVGYVIESKMSENRGVVATVLVSDGTLHRGDVLLTGNGYGKVRLMYGWDGATCESGGPSDAVSVIGLNNVPEVGEKVYAVSDMAKARKLAEEREIKSREQALASQRRRHVSLENLMEHLDAKDNVKELNVIIKADVTGTLEVLQKTISDMATEEIHINIIHAAVGGISQADVILADASDAIIVGFHVVADSAAKLQATSLDVQIKTYHVIYRLIEDMKAALVGMLPKEEKEVVRGHIEVRKVFHTSKFGNIAGCAVTDGVVNRKCRVRLIRDKVVIYDGALESLKRGKDDAKEVRGGYECGLRISNYDDIHEGDTMEAYEIESVERTLD